MALTDSELLTYIQSIAREKDIPFPTVIKIFGDALAQSLKSRAREFNEAGFRVEINPETGAISARRFWRVLAEDEVLEHPERELMLERARDREPAAQPGDEIFEPIPNADAQFFLRAGVQRTKQFLNIHLREEERRRLLSELLERREDLVSGQVLRLLRNTGDAIVEVMRVECRLAKRDMIPYESIKPGDRIQALIKNMDALSLEPPEEEQRGEMRGERDKEGRVRHPVLLTRTSPEFLIRLFQRVVPEIEKGILEIVNAVRSPGNRAKIAVRSHDQRVDPVGTCVGIRGSRVQQVTNELNGERIDIIPWDEDDGRFVLNALSPAEVSKVHIDREKHSMDILVEPELLAQAIGKTGVNARLASALTQWRLNLRAPEEYQAAAEEELAGKSEVLAKALDLDVNVSRVLCEEGFETLAHVAYAPPSDLLEIDGFTPEMVEEMQNRAREVAAREEKALTEKVGKMDGELVTLFGEHGGERLRQLAAADITTLLQFSDLAIDDLLEIAEMPEEEAGALIMEARKILEAKVAEMDELLARAFGEQGEEPLLRLAAAGVRTLSQFCEMPAGDISQITEMPEEETNARIAQAQKILAAAAKASAAGAE